MHLKIKTCKTTEAVTSWVYKSYNASWFNPGIYVVSFDAGLAFGRCLYRFGHSTRKGVSNLMAIEHLQGHMFCVKEL